MTLQEVSNFIRFVEVQSLELLVTDRTSETFPYDTATRSQSFNNPVQTLAVRRILRHPDKYLAFVKGPGGITYAIFLLDNAVTRFRVTHVLFKHDVDSFIHALTGVRPPNYSRSLFLASSVEWLP